MRVLILNWRSIKDPLAGGAEVATFEHCKRWVRKHSASVTWLCPPYAPDGPAEEIIDGVNFVYVGKPLSRNVVELVFLFPYFFFCVIYTYYKKYRNHIDVVVDEIHGVPFLTPLYVKEKIVLFVCEVAGPIWDKMFVFPISFIGRLLERVSYIPYILRNIDVVTISNSTKKDLTSLGVVDKKIKVVLCGLSMPVLQDRPVKEKIFTMLFLNRVVKMKGIERALRIFARFKEKYVPCQLWVVGDVSDSYRAILSDLANQLNISSEVTFFGYVNTQEKLHKLASSHVLINTSYKEGWSMVNIEANANYTPVVAFNVSGNCDSVKNNVSGVLVQDDFLGNFVDTLYNIATKRLTFPNVISYARSFDWNINSDEFYRVLLGC